MANEKLTARKIVAIVVLTVIGTVVLEVLYWGIIFFTAPITENFTVSYILATSTVAAIIVVPLVAHTLKKRKKEVKQN